MTKKIYISPSDQTENRYAWGNTNEHAQCQKIAEAEAAALRRSGVEVKLAAFGTTMAQRCAESDAWGADIHSCVHTNAEKMLDRLKKAGFTGFVVEGTR